MLDLVARQIAGTDSGLSEALVAAHLPTEDLTEGNPRFFRFERNGEIVGYGGFEPHRPYALMRSVVVLPMARGKGLGRAVAEGLMQRAAAEDCPEVFLLTTSAVEFFRHLGFRPIDRADAPRQILATRQAAAICSTATLLARRLDE